MATVARIFIGLNHVDSRMAVLTGVGLALMGLSVPGKRLASALQPIVFVAGLALVVGAAFRPWWLAEILLAGAVALAFHYEKRDWRLGVLLEYLPTLNAPKRRIRFRRSRVVYKTRPLSELVDKVKKAEAAAARPQRDLPKVKPIPRSASSSSLAKVAAGHEEPPASSLLETAAGDALTSSQKVYEESHRQREKVLARSLSQEGERLHSELWEHAEAAKHQQPLASLPKVYLGQAEDWANRFAELAKRHLPAKERVQTTEVYPHIGKWATFGPVVEKFVDDLDKMFTKNLSALARIEKKL